MRIRLVTISKRLAGPGVGRRVVVAGDHAAERDPPAERHPADRRLEDAAADVVEVDVDAGRAQLAQAGRDVLALVVDRGRQLQLLHQPAAFRRPASDPDHAAAFQLRNLRRGRAGRARRTRNEHGLARDNLGDVQEAEMRGQTDAAQDAEIVGQWMAGRDLHRRGLGHHGVVLPAESADDEISGAHLGAARFDDLPDGPGAHHLPDWLGRNVARSIVQERSHGRVERHVERPHQALVLLRDGRCALRVFESRRASPSRPGGGRAAIDDSEVRS